MIKSITRAIKYIYTIAPSFLLLAFCILSSCSSRLPGQGPGDNTGQAMQAAAWVTNPDKSQLFSKQSPDLIITNASVALPTIEVDMNQTYQVMDGFGYTLTGGSAQLLYEMKPAARAAILKELFDTTGNNIGVSYLRVSIGASDLDDHVFSYDDLAAGQTDQQLQHFTLNEDRKHLLPVLKEILSIYPRLKILGSPWSPPVWMKTNHESMGGSLLPQWYNAYAQYFVKYIDSMKAEGITIDAITIQNEPLHGGNNPSMVMQANEQADFIKNHLGPAFKAADIHTKIILYDHNADRPNYPISILNDAQAKPYIDGTAFHLYGGTIDALTSVHNAHPEKKLYFTEQWIGAPANFEGDFNWHVKTLLIGAPRNWAVNVLEWNLAADANQNPHTPGGCTKCLGAITIDGNQITREPAYYIIAHASKFVRPGSVRIQSTLPGGLVNVAYKTPAGKIVLIVLNDTGIKQAFQIKLNGRFLIAMLEKGAAGTYVWEG